MKILTKFPRFVSFQCLHDPMLSYHAEQSYAKLISAVASLTPWSPKKGLLTLVEDDCYFPPQVFVVYRFSDLPRSLQGSYVHEWIAMVCNVLH